MILDKLKLLFSKSLRLPIFINTWNHRVIARKGVVFSPELLLQASKMGKIFKQEFININDTFIIRDIEKILKKELKNYGFITENLKFVDDIIEVIGKVKVPEQIISEIQWMKENYSYNYHHIMAVTAITTRIARDFFLEETDILKTAEASLIYDIGIGHVDSSIVQKIGGLSQEQRNIINFHPIYSALLIAHYYHNDQMDFIEPILNHHENQDGTGFPRKIMNKNILSQVIKLADTFDALISARPFRRFYPPKEAFKICEEMINAGKITPEILPIIYSYFLFIDQYPT